MSTLPVARFYLPVDASTGKPLYPDGDEIRNPFASPELDYRTAAVFALEFVDRKAAADLSWILSPRPLDAERSYVLSGGSGSDADLFPMFVCDAAGLNLPGDWPDGSTADLALGRLTFRFRTDERQFAVVAAHPEWRKCCSAVVSVSDGNDSAVIARIPFRPRNRTGESPGGSGGSGGSSGGGVTAINGITGAVVLTDADGEALPVSGKSIALPVSGRGLIADPVAGIPVYDSVWGYCRYLDATFSQIGYIGRIRNLKRVRLETVSANPAVAGNIVLIPRVNGTDRSPVIVPVGAEPGETVFSLEIASGTLTLRRDVKNAADTLQDGGAVTAVILDTVFEVEYASR